LLSKVNVQLLRRPVQVIIGTKSMVVLRQCVLPLEAGQHNVPKADPHKAPPFDRENAPKAAGRIAPEAYQEKIA
jgi:hypothetical protein